MQRIKIISGAQTGVDRAALDAAMACGLDCGGSIPRGRLAEDGPVDARYSFLTELESEEYTVRTKRNVLDAEATLILCPGTPEGGTALTECFARTRGRPVLAVDIDAAADSRIIRQVKAWLDEHTPSVLNIAGPRESRFPGVYARTRAILKKLFREITTDDRKR